jgi:hypothetical protein
MSEDNRKRPCILRVLPTVDARVRAYAARQGLAPNVAAEDLINGAAAEIAALDKQLVAARDDLESAREATRRADAEVERLTRELTISEENTAAAVRLVERREKELAEAKRTTDKLRIEVERVTEERDTERRLDVAAQEALRADVAREIAANRKLEAELAETRAALATKGATERLAERLETIAVDVDRRACACALPDDLAPRLAAIAARRDVEPHVMLANVIKNGISKIEASDKYQDAQKAARARS